MKPAMCVAEDVVRLVKTQSGEPHLVAGCVIVDRGTDSVGKTWLCAELMCSRIAAAVTEDRAHREAGRAVKTPLEIAEELVVLEHVPGRLRMFIRPVMFDQYGLEATKLFTALARMAIAAAIEQDRTSAPHHRPRAESSRRE
ncbi:MAG: hypothetical protein HUU21_00430 [Polyangiaceae bacterium]|nr:hypothetical protein [Polyangiaceae bacterium]